MKPIDWYLLTRTGVGHNYALLLYLWFPLINPFQFSAAFHIETNHSGQSIQEWTKYNFLKTVFYKFDLVHSWILCLTRFALRLQWLVSKFSETLGWYGLSSSILADYSSTTVLIRGTLLKCLVVHLPMLMISNSLIYCSSFTFDILLLHFFKLM